VSKSKRKPIIGILGGVGSGKSAVAAEFGKLGCAVIDADEIAHELLNKPSVKKKVSTAFGEAVLGRGGEISRRKLAEVVFADGKKLVRLNRIIHPPTLKRVNELIGEAEHKNDVKAIVLDMPLLAEVGWAKRCDKLVFVNCKAKIRAKRAKKCGILSENELEKREKFQISLYKKKAIADNTIDNNSGFSALAGQVNDIFSNMMGK
jgi:dephospho-CoA kinase